MILTYHRITDREGGCRGFYEIGAARFERQMALLACRIVRSDWQTFWLSNGRSVFLTFDDGTNDHVIVGDRLHELGLVGVFFVITGRIGRDGCLSRADIRRLVAQGHRLGSHTATHRRLPSLSTAEIVEELRTSRASLEDLTSSAVDWIAPPGGAVCQRSLEIAEEVGFQLIRTMDWGYAPEPPTGVVPCLPVLPYFSLGGFERLLDGHASLWAYEIKCRLKGLVGERIYVSGRNAVARLWKTPPEPVGRAARDAGCPLSKEQLSALLGREAHANDLDLHYWRDRQAFPRLIGFDVDALLPRRSWPQMFRLLQAILPSHRWEVLMSHRRGQVWTCLLARQDANPCHDDDFLVLDFHSDLAVGGLPYANRVALLRRAHVSNGVRWLDDIDAAVVSYLEPAIAHGRVKERYVAALERARMRAPAAVRLLVEDAVGRAGAAALLAAPAAPAPQLLIRAGLSWTALTRRPCRTSSILLHKVIDAVAMFCRPSGQLWTMSGPDGVGKTTVFECLRALVERRIVVAVDPFHTRPYLIPRLATFLPRRRRNEILRVRRYERKIGVLKSVLRLAILIVDYQIGYWLKVRHMLAQGHLVVFDRYYQDILVDPRIRGIVLPPAWLRACARLIPRGDRHVYITAPSTTLLARKNELSREEAVRQVECYRRLALEDRRAVVIATENRPAADVAVELANVLLNDLRAAARARFGPIVQR